MNYINLKSILLLIPKTIKDQTDEDTILEYALNAYKSMSINKRFEYKLEVLEVVNHRVTLPTGLVKINQVSYFEEQPCSEDVNEILSLCEEDTTTTTTTTPTESHTSSDLCKIINYRIWFENTFYRKYLSPLKFIGNASNLFCRDCPNLACSQCTETFSLDVYSKSLLFQNIESGYICLDYVSELIDENGDYLIPDDEDLKMGLALYAIAHCWRDRAYTKEEQAFKFYDAELSKAEVRLKKARSKFLLNALDIKLIHSINYQQTRHLYLPSVWVHL